MTRTQVVVAWAPKANGNAPNAQENAPNAHANVPNAHGYSPNADVNALNLHAEEWHRVTRGRQRIIKSQVYLQLKDFETKKPTDKGSLDSVKVPLMPFHSPKHPLSLTY